MSGEAVQIRLLGPVDVSVGDSARALSGLRRKTVLAMLALHAGRTVSTDWLVDVVWGANAPATALNTVQSHMSYLRRVLGDRCPIVARPPGYVLDIAPDTVDASVAERLIRDSLGTIDHAGKAAQLRQALDLWRGHSLADVTGPIWLDQQAGRLENLRVEAAEALVEARLALGEAIQLVPELQQLTAKHPFRENLHRQLMIALYRGGRQADALATYQRLRRTIGRELGLDPSPALRELEAQILRQDVALDPRPAPVSVPITPAIPAQLPLAIATFTGRDAELAELDDFLASGPDAARPSVHVATISGSAGVGKTALAVHWAHAIATRFPDGQLYVNLRGFDARGSVMSSTEALHGFLEAFAVLPHRIPASEDGRAALFRSVLSHKRVLIVVDNARDEAHIRPLLPGSSGCLVVATSRDGLSGLAAIDGAHPLDLRRPSTTQAREMLVRRLGHPRVAAEPDAIDAIIASCARLPLALAIVAARASAHPGLPLATLATALRDTAATLDPFTQDFDGTVWRVRCAAAARGRLPVSHGHAAEMPGYDQSGDISSPRWTSADRRQRSAC
jgi:DNA-binding SARP family transcriptional activator